MDVGAESLNTGGLVLLEKRCAGKADEHRIRQQFLHRTVKLAALCTVSLIDEDEEIALQSEPLEQGLLELTNEVFGLALILLVITPELMHQGAHQPRLVPVEHADHAGSRRRPFDGLIDTSKNLLDLLIQLRAVSDH